MWKCRYRKDQGKVSGTFGFHQTRDVKGVDGYFVSLLF